jgi:putative Mg2+ transporter-C (MgtC) family protein
MSTTITLTDVLLRLGLAVAAGGSIGIDRGRHGRAAGVRTMLLVCTGAALAMILANWMTLREGSPAGELGTNPARFAQGMLAGIGFLGAGAILRKGSIVRGITTAASIWYVTILGLTFGLGYWQVGLIGWGIAIAALLGLPYLELHIHSDRYASVAIVTRAEGMNAEEFCQRLEGLGLTVETFSIDYQVAEKLKTIRCNVQYHVGRQLELPRRVVADLAGRAGVIEVRWK